VTSREPCRRDLSDSETAVLMRLHGILFHICFCIYQYYFFLFLGGGGGSILGELLFSLPPKRGNLETMRGGEILLRVSSCMALELLRILLFHAQICDLLHLNSAYLQQGLRNTTLSSDKCLISRMLNLRFDVN